MKRQFNIHRDKNWIKLGLLWGVLMWISNIAFEFIFDDKPIAGKGVLMGIPFWLIGGLLFGYLMKLITPNKNLERS